jgi:hypothetical protein
MQSDLNDLFGDLLSGSQRPEAPAPREDRPPSTGITRETRDRILRIIKDRTGVSDDPSMTDEFV